MIDRELKFYVDLRSVNWVELTVESKHNPYINLVNNIDGSLDTLEKG